LLFVCVDLDALGSNQNASERIVLCIHFSVVTFVLQPTLQTLTGVTAVDSHIFYLRNHSELDKFSVFPTMTDNITSQNIDLSS